MKQQLNSAFAVTDNPAFTIPTYIINLKKRTDRKDHVLAQFKGRDEFTLNIVEAFEHSKGALGLWATIRHILLDLVRLDSEYILIGEDDVEFTEHYSKEHLLAAINEAKEKNADVLLGGISWCKDALKISDNLFWTHSFSGTHFTIIFKKFFPLISQTHFTNTSADHKMASLSDNILFLHPFIATQKDFGYSDATVKNNEAGRVQQCFDAVEEKLLLLNTIKLNIGNVLKDAEQGEYDQSFDSIIIPTYVINLPERTERLAHIKQEFLGKPEFDVQIVEACKHEVGALGLWLSIRKVINMAIANDDDVIIISEDDHQFTKDYTKEYLIKNIMEAHEEGACYLSGGTANFENAFAITTNRFWVYHCLSTQFVVVFKKFFQQILDEPFDEEIIADRAYSEMTSNKMVLHPFISTQKDFGYSDITEAHNKSIGLVDYLFKNSDYRFKRIKGAYTKYHIQQERKLETEKQP